MDRCFHDIIYGFMDLNCFGPKAGYINFSACAFLDVFWSAGVRASFDITLCVTFSPYFIRLSFLRPIPILSRFSMRQVGHAPF